MRLLVLTSCTGDKCVSDPNQLTLEDFRQGPDHLIRRERELAELLTPAEDLYTGLQHQRLMQGVRALREHSSDIQLDLHILSAGYGLMPGNRPLAPYEATFSGMRKPALRDWAKRLQIPQGFRALLAEPYDFGLVLLGNEYLDACLLASDVTLGGPTLLFCGLTKAKSLPKLPNLRAVPLTNADAKRFSCALIGLKGELAARILRRPPTPRLASQLCDPASKPLDLLDDAKPAKPTKPTRGKARPNPNVDHVIALPDSWRDKPHRQRLRYFIPEWDDLVDPDYDFDTDTHSGGSGDWSNEVYAHQMYPEPNYDGLLVSKVVAEKSKKKKERINRLGVHRFLRVPRDFPVMGDCGAFGYIGEDDPPYTTDEILDYYTRLDFDYGVSIDHLIVSSNQDAWKHRYQLTIDNAADFIREHRQQGLGWTPIGAVQGWDPKKYADAAQQMAKMGYRYLALGGLVRSTTADINKIVHAVREVIPREVQLHVFGVARPSAIAGFRDLGVDSVDSAGALRQAWMRTAQSYLFRGEPYAAIRIPEAGKSFRAKHMEKNGLKEDDIRDMEQAALSAVRGFDAGTVDLEKCLKALLQYDQFVTSERADMEPLYRRVLSAAPWKRCDCAICQTWGVEVIIFRGNNRNRRRGFHNTHDFYRTFQHVALHETSTVVEELNIRQGSLFDEEAEAHAG